MRNFSEGKKRITRTGEKQDKNRMPKALGTLSEKLGAILLFGHREIAPNFLDTLYCSTCTFVAERNY